MTLLTEPTRIVLAKGQPVPNDPYLYTNTVLLLHGDGTNGSTTILDSSKVAGSPKTVTAFGNAQISTAIADPFGNSTRGVIAFDGTNAYVTTPNNNSLAMQTGDFTIELFARFSLFRSFAMLYDSRNGGSSSLGLALMTAADGTLWAYSGTTNYITSSPLSLNTWYHIALTRSSNSLRMFINGIQAGSTTAFANNLSDGWLNIGKTNESMFNFFGGLIDEVRITKGISRYNATFTPPTAPFPDF